MTTKNHLISILENTKNTKTKRVVNGLLDVINNGEIDEVKISGLVNESLKGLSSEDEVVKTYFSYLNTKTILENLGVRSIINAAKGTKLYETDENLKGLVDSYEEHTQNHPEYAIADQFLTGIKRYNWNKFIKAPVAVMESNIAKYKTYKLVAEAIYALQNIKDADLYEEAVKKLDYAFHLPENQVRSYIRETFMDDSVNNHSIIRELVEQLYKIPQESTSNITWHMSKDGRTSVAERISPVLVEEGREIIMMNGRLYEIKEGEDNTEKIKKLEQELKDLESASPRMEDTIKKAKDQLAKLKNSNESKSSIKKITNIKEAKIPEKFLQLCETFSKFVVVDKKLKITDGLYEFAISEKNGKPVYEVDGVPQPEPKDDVMGNLSTMGVEAGLINLLSIAGDSISDIVILDNVLSVIPDEGRAVIDILKIGGKYTINIFDASNGVDEIVTGDANIDAVTQVKTDYGIDVAPFIANEDENIEGAAGADPEKEAKDAELNQKIEALKSQLEEITDNMQKIEDLDEDYQKEGEIQKMYDDLKKNKSDLEEDIKKMEAEKAGTPIVEDMSEVVENIFSEINTMKNDAETLEQIKTDDAPDAHAQKPGGIYNINDDISVIPVIELEKAGEGFNISAIYLQVASKLKEKDVFQEELTKALEGSKFTVADDGHVNLNISAAPIDADLTDEIKTDIASIINSVSVTKPADNGAATPATTPAEEPVV